MENRVYICSWSHDGERYRVWVHNRPTVCAEDVSFEEADIALAIAICGAFGDGEAVAEYDRARPDATGVPGLAAVFVILSGGSWATAENAKGLYEGGWCQRCGGARGARTAEPLRLGKIDGSMDCGSCINGEIRFFSEGFLDLLVPAERDACEWRRVERTRRAKKVYYELVGSRLHAPTVALAPVVEDLWHILLAEARGRSGILDLKRCELCGYETGNSYLYMKRGLPRWYVDIAALRTPLPTSFTTGQPANKLRFCLLRERWQSILGKPGTRGISSSEIGVVESYLVGSHPVPKPWS